MLLWRENITICNYFHVAVLTYMECFSDANYDDYNQRKAASQSSPIWNASLTPVVDSNGTIVDVAVLTYMECFSDFNLLKSALLHNVAVLTYMECFSDSSSVTKQSVLNGRSPHLYGMLLWHYCGSRRMWSSLSQSSPIWNASLTQSPFLVNILQCRSPHLYGMLLWHDGNTNTINDVIVAVLTYMECFSDIIGSELERYIKGRSPHLYGMLLWRYGEKSVKENFIVAVLTYMECFSDHSCRVKPYSRWMSQSSPIWNASLTFSKI